MPAKVTLTITEGKLAGQEFIFDSRTTCIVGRANDCNIKIPNDAAHQTISHYHCLTLFCHFSYTETDGD
jgi:hypothetical protein